MAFKNLQIEVPNSDEVPQHFAVKVYKKKYHNKTNFVIGFDPDSEEAQARKKERMRRFNIKPTEEENNTNTENSTNEKTTTEKKLGTFEDIEVEELKWPTIPDCLTEEIRHDALLLHGVNNMSTKDVFEYFNLYGPSSLEWIDDFSCNVVWDSEDMVIQAMESMSKTYDALKKINASECAVVVKEEVRDDVDDAIPVEDDAIEPKEIWRVGKPYKGVPLFFRHASIKDKKLPGAASRSEYYLKYGRNPLATQKNPGILSKSRKRKLQRMQQMADQKYKDNTPQVRIMDMLEMKNEGLVQKMEVDDGPTMKRMNLHTREEVVQNTMSMVADQIELQNKLGKRYNPTNVKDRIGTNPNLQNDNESEESDYNDDNDNYHTTNRNTTRSRTSVHDRLGNKEPHNEPDARHEIRSARLNNRNHGYEDDDGIYHDVYYADHVKVEEREKHKETPKLKEPPKDLRSKIKVKNEDEDKLNLCIEIKREPDDEEVEAMDFEF